MLVCLRRAVRLVRLQYEYQYDCRFLKSVELTVAGRGVGQFMNSLYVAFTVRPRLPAGKHGPHGQVQYARTPLATRTDGLYGGYDDEEM